MCMETNMKNYLIYMQFNVKLSDQYDFNTQIIKLFLVDSYDFDFCDCVSMFSAYDC
jgi:hypothetical protein